MKNAIVTFVIGERYEQMHAIFRPSVEKYCKKYDIDYIVLDKPLDTDISNHHKIGIQKLLITLQEWSSKYDNIMWLDSDIYISPNAENIFDEVVDGKICMANPIVHEHDRLYDGVIAYNKGWADTRSPRVDFAAHISSSIKMAKEYDVYSPEDKDFKCYPNQGVIIFQPKYHTEYLKKLYDDEVKRNINHPTTDKYGRKNPNGEWWFVYKFQADDMLHLIDHNYNKLWAFYRSLHYEPYDDPSDLIIPMKNFIESSYFCHFTDMENAEILNTIKTMYFEAPETTLVVNGNELSWLLSKYIRAKSFKNIYIVSDSDEAKNFMVSRFPREQFGFRFPDHKYTFVRKAPDIQGRCIVCDSDWVKKIDFNYILKLFNHDEYVHDAIHVKNNIGTCQE